MTNAIKFATGKPKYTKRKIDWYAIWAAFDEWDEYAIHAEKDARLYLEGLVNKQLKSK